MITDRLGWSEAYRRLSPRLPDHDVVLMDGRKPLVLGIYAGAVDLEVVHPPTRLSDGRPDWLYAMGRHPVPVPADLLPRHGSRLVQAFAASERSDPVPIDQVVVTAGAPPPALALPPGMAIRYAWQGTDGVTHGMPSSR